MNSRLALWGEQVGGRGGEGRGELVQGEGRRGMRQRVLERQQQQQPSVSGGELGGWLSAAVVLPVWQYSTLCYPPETGCRC